MGYPVSSIAMVLYDGLISSIEPTYLDLFAPVKGTDIVAKTPRRFYRLQLPASPGASGSPVVSDDGYLVGIITEVPTSWPTELETFKEAHLSLDASKTSDPDALTARALSLFADAVEEYGSPGSALATPATDLVLTADQMPGSPHPRNQYHAK
jgi:hypothetical protein